ncbi:acyltransferase [Formosa algae]|uniref:Acetyltransferase-like isoleucine patch superfamily enzyme n=2 Tax=Formosa algae TaxID=225843 RepID=A0A9X0YJK2_9FLAO|nr:acyltransferase [Formosa algae]MBP1839113.1 acetyltransferase-like isoleucine patch superfamily enzyme [Formosa algae]MDQ0333890.1 acetyltransferase-like isoleucine patch superfamily enzyme [Formosa algae]
MNKYIYVIKRINIKTLYFNFKYLPFKEAVKLPVFLSRHVCLKKIKGKVIINSKIRTGMIKIGFGDVSIFDNKKSRTILKLTGTIIFNGNTDIGHGACLSIGGVLELGNNFNITAESSIICSKNIKFGDNVLMSWECLFMDSDLHTIIDEKGNVINSPKSIIIGDNVWIGCRCTLLKGSRIANGSIIGAGSIITNDISMDSGLFVGSPARLIKKGLTWN